MLGEFNLMLEASISILVFTPKRLKFRHIRLTDFDHCHYTLEILKGDLDILNLYGFLISV